MSRKPILKFADILKVCQLVGADSDEAYEFLDPEMQQPLQELAEYVQLPGLENDEVSPEEELEAILDELDDSEPPSTDDLEIQDPVP